MPEIQEAKASKHRRKRDQEFVIVNHQSPDHFMTNGNEEKGKQTRKDKYNGAKL